MTTETIRNGQITSLNIPSGQSLAVVAVSGTYSASITAGAGIGVIATAATGATYGPYANGSVIRLTASAASEIDYEVAVSPVIVSDTPVFAVVNPTTGAQSLNLPIAGSTGSFTTLSATGSIISTVVYTNTSDVGLVSSATTPGLNLRTASTGRFSLMQSYSSSNLTQFLVGTGTNNPTTETLRLDGATGLVTAMNGLAVTGVVSTSGYTVATLPAGTVGQRAYVTDATTPTYNGALVGGGAVVVPVFRNATVWVSA